MFMFETYLLPTYALAAGSAPELIGAFDRGACVRIASPGLFIDDGWANGYPTEEDTHAVEDMGLSKASARVTTTTGPAVLCLCWKHGLRLCR